MKIKSILISILLLACLGLSSCSNAMPNRSTNPITDSTTVAITIYAFNGKSEKVFGIPNLGHAFVSLKNLTNAPLTVGIYDIMGGEEVTIGTWGQSAHWGIWYNLEAHYLKMGRYKGIVSVTRALEAGKLEEIGNYLSVSDYWTPFTNCSAFALALWNLVSGDDAIDPPVGVVTPSSLRKEILRFEGSEFNRQIEPQTNASFYNGEELIFVEQKA